MSNSLALVLGLIILGSVLTDVVLFDAEHLVFLGKKFLAFTEWLAFWR